MSNRKLTLICQPAFLLIYLLSCPPDFNLKTCCDMREKYHGNHFKSYVKKNFKYLPKHVSLQKILDPTETQIKDYKRLFCN